GVRPLRWLRRRVGDGPLEVLRRHRVVLQKTYMQEDIEADALMPPVRLILRDEDRGGSVPRPVGEHEPHPLGDGARVSRPGPQVDVPSVLRLYQISVDTLQ